MIVDPTNPQQGITTSGDLAAQVFFLPAGAGPTGDLSGAVFIGLTDPPTVMSDRDADNWFDDMEAEAAKWKP